MSETPTPVPEITQLIPKEIKAIIIAVETTIEDIHTIKRLPEYNQLTQKAKDDQQELLENLLTAKEKLKKVSGYHLDMRGYQEGDEKDITEPTS